MRLSQCCVLVLAAIAASAAFAQIEGGPFRITRSTMDAGGGRSAGGPYRLTGTIAQPDAGSRVAGGAFGLAGGFWASGEAAPAGEAIFADGFESP